MYKKLLLKFYKFYFLEYGIWPEKIRSVVSVANLNKILRSARGIDAGEIFGSDQIKELAFDLRVKTLRLLMEELLEEIKGTAQINLKSLSYKDNKNSGLGLQGSQSLVSIRSLILFQKKAGFGSRLVSL